MMHLAFALASLAFHVDVQPASTRDVALALALTPGAFVAGGNTASNYGAALARIDSAAEQRAAWATLHASLDTLNETLASIQAQVTEDPTSESLATEYQQTESAVAEKRAEIATLKVQVRSIALGLDSSSQAAAPVAVDATLPQSLAAAVPDAANAAQLRLAYLAERKAEREERPLEESAAAQLDAARSSSAFEVAQSALSTQLAAAQAALDSHD